MFQCIAIERKLVEREAPNALLKPALLAQALSGMHARKSITDASKYADILDEASRSIRVVMSWLRDAARHAEKKDVILRGATKLAN